MSGNVLGGVKVSEKTTPLNKKEVYIGFKKYVIMDNTNKKVISTLSKTYKIPLKKDIIDGIINGTVTLKEVMAQITTKVQGFDEKEINQIFAINSVKDSVKRLSPFLNENPDENLHKKEAINKVSFYYEVLNSPSAKNIEEGLFIHEGKEYVKYDGEIYNIEEIRGKTVIACGILNGDYKLFKINGSLLRAENEYSGINTIDICSPTGINEKGNLEELYTKTMWSKKMSEESECNTDNGKNIEMLMNTGSGFSYNLQIITIDKDGKTYKHNVFISRRFMYYDNDLGKIIRDFINNRKFIADPENGSYTWDFHNELSELKNKINNHLGKVESKGIIKLRSKGRISRLFLNKN